MGIMDLISKNEEQVLGWIPTVIEDYGGSMARLKCVPHQIKEDCALAN